MASTYQRTNIQICRFGTHRSSTDVEYPDHDSVLWRTLDTCILQLDVTCFNCLMDGRSTHEANPEMAGENFAQPRFIALSFLALDASTVFPASCRLG